VHRVTEQLDKCRFVHDGDYVALQTIKYESAESAGFENAQNIDRAHPNTWALRAGPRKTIYFNPPDVTAAIVTCGGLCPGLNDVIQHCVFTLLEYGVREENILGIKYAHVHLCDIECDNGI
jgi:6-phosphofructokinase 1